MERGSREGCFIFYNSEWSEHVLDSSGLGLWHIVTDRAMKEAGFYVDRTMAGLLGLKVELTPEECFEFWYKRINRGNYSYVNEAFGQMFRTDKLCEVQYTWNHPDWGDIPVRLAGRACERKDGRYQISGYHQNMADLDQMKRWSLNMGRQEMFEYNITSRSALVYTDRMLTYGGERQIRDFPQSWIDQGIVHPDFHEAFLQTFEAVKRGEEQSSCELRLKNRDREYSWFSMELEVTVCGEGSPEIIIGRLNDISRQKSVEMAYIRETRLNRAILGDTMAYAEVNVTANKLERLGGAWNCYRKLTDYQTYEGMILDASRKRVFGKDRRKYMEFVSRNHLLGCMQRGGTKLECEYRRLTDQNEVFGVRHVIRLYRDKASGDVLAFNCLSNIDREKHSGEETRDGRMETWGLTDEEGDFDKYLSGVADIAYLVEPCTYNLICGNLAFYRTLGKTGRECRGRKCYELLYDRTSPCVFCPRHNWSRDRSCIWENYNQVLGNRFLYKNRLVEWRGKETLLAFAIDIGDGRQPMEGADLSKRAGEAESKVISCLYAMAEAASAEDSMKQAARMLAGHYRPEHIRVLLPKDHRFGYTCMGGWDSQEAEETCRLMEQHLEEWLNRTLPAASKSLNSAQEMLLESFELYQDMETLHISNLFVVPMKVDSEFPGYVAVMNRDLQQPLQLLEMLPYFLGQEIRKRRVSQRLQYNIYHDSLTGLQNRSSYDEYRRSYDKDSIRALGVICVDINDLRTVNEQMGSAQGDELICRLGGILGKRFKNHRIFRLNSNEFDMILENISQAEFGRREESLRADLEGDIGMSVSVGCVWDDRDKSLDVMQKQAVELMRLDKQRFYERRPQTRPTGRTEAIRQLLQATESRKFRVLLQPQVGLETGMASGAEALIRYYDDRMGMIGPTRFIEMLERENLISYIDLFVLEEVCRLLKRWKEREYRRIHVSFNFSRMTLLNSDIVESTESIVKKYGVDRGCLEIEVTESVGELGRDTVCKTLGRFKALGYRISLDDFGTKYSNLAILSEIEFDVLKLDKSLVDKLRTDRISRQVVSHVISMCNDLGILTVAEGVEEKGQEQILKQARCAIGQGYLYGRPMAEEAFEQEFLE